ncbi:Brp/Blh family beta-carotene 15,15'-dioxygenase [Muriicola sp. SD30]|uniref:Brp/Blh family beta-carotene 15,15'-dioxygenase n=1 Tax=Muriicola sp. SD30 TaxID=3240936 RepID=UPI0035100585
MIVLTFFFLWITVNFNIEAEAVLAYFLIFTFGILHGSNDLKLIQQTSSISKKKFFLRALASYVAVIALTVVFFAIVPTLALVFFVLASSYHFGEQHWSNRIKSSPLSYLFYSCYGLVIFFLLFYTNAEEVSSIIYQVTGIQILATYYLYVLCASFAGFLVIFLWSQRKNKFKVNLVKELFFLLVFAIVFKTASLLWAFSIYFVVWHSIPSLMDQTTYLYGKVNKNTLLKYLKTSFVYWLVSMIGLGILYFLFHEKQGLFLSLMIYFLAAITFPHVIVMNRLNRG